MFYFGKNLLVKHFIGEFLKKPPIIAVNQTQTTDWQEQYHTIGEIKALQSINLSAQAPGLIKKINFKSGQHVQKNTLLLQLDNKVELAQFKLQLADYLLQKKLFQQQEQLWQSKTISQSQFLQAKANLDKSRAAMQAAKAHLKEKQIRAPFSGIVGIPEVHKGQYISPGQQHIASLQQTNQLYLDFHLPEKYFKNLQPGSTIHFKTENSASFDQTAVIDAIEPASQQMAHTIWVRAIINNAHHQFIPGLLTQVQVPIKLYKHAITIPTAALLGSSKGAIVYVANQKINPETKKSAWFIQERLVKLGPAKKDQTLILAGLKPREWIVTSGTQKVQPSSWAIVKG